MRVTSSKYKGTYVFAHVHADSFQFHLSFEKSVSEICVPIPLLRGWMGLWMVCSTQSMKNTILKIQQQYIISENTPYYYIHFHLIILVVPKAPQKFPHWNKKCSIHVNYESADNPQPQFTVHYRVNYTEQGSDLQHSQCPHWSVIVHWPLCEQSWLETLFNKEKKNLQENSLIIQSNTNTFF